MRKEFRAFRFQQLKILSIKQLQHNSLVHNWKFRRTVFFCFLSSAIQTDCIEGKYWQPTLILLLKTESYCPDRIALCNHFLSLTSEISFRCAGNNKDFFCNENNPSLARNKQEILVKEEELPKKSKEEFAVRTLTVSVFQITLTEADQAAWGKYTMTKCTL